MEPTPGQEPSQITVTVYSARNLPSRRKGEVCHASVVFGVGKDCYMTETIESNNPEWNQEAHIAILGRLNSTMKFKVRDKDHTLGVLQMTLLELTSHKGQKWYPLQPHKKSHDKKLHENLGELLVGCWVSEYKAVSPEKPSPSTSRTSSNEDLRKGHRKERFSFHGRTPSGGRVKHLPHEMSPTSSEKPLASSDYEIHSKRALPSFQSDTNLRFVSLGLHDDHSEKKQVTPEQSPLDSSSLLGEPESLKPEVTGISPNEGPVEGSQRVILRGSNLGESRSDVVRVVLADVDCTSTLEYFSPAKLAVTTSPRHSPGSGPVLVETVRGGVGVSSITFTFVAMEAVSGIVNVIESHSPFVRKRKQQQQHQEVELELQTELKGLRQQLRDLKDENVQLRDENQSLKNYIDRLLLGIISTSPEILEVKGESTSRRSQSLLGPLSTDY